MSYNSSSIGFLADVSKSVVVANVAPAAPDSVPAAYAVQLLGYNAFLEKRVIELAAALENRPFYLQ